MQGLNLIALSIPVFFALIGIELLVARLRGEKLYRFNDSINDLSCGILQQALGVFTKAIVFGGYVLLFEAGHLFEISATSPVTWVLCFLGVDFFYYWFHRVSHESALPWGAHVVHHSSEEYNLAVALRQGSFQPLFSWIFYLPLAVLGFPPLVFLTCSSLNTLYQFWIHTRTIGKLGPLEWVLNTPSHHRVHHGCDDKYLDRNYAGTLIVWDRLFGSFQEEEEEPTYGITHPLRSWNPLWANVHFYADLVQKGRGAPSLAQKIKVWFAPPGYRPEWDSPWPPESDHETPLTHGDAGKYDSAAPKGLYGYVWLQFLVTVALTVFLLFRGSDLSLAERVALVLLIAWTATNLGGIFDLKRWLLLSELSRLAVLWGLGVLWVGPEARLAVVVAGALAAGGFASWLLRYRGHLGGAEPVTE
ncbi:MAG: sterol desaturase family protein [bacterium]|nr:sterol desaturase family protein [bacterium]